MPPLPPIFATAAALSACRQVRFRHFAVLFSAQFASFMPPPPFHYAPPLLRFADAATLFSD